MDFSNRKNCFCVKRFPTYVMTSTIILKRASAVLQNAFIWDALLSLVLRPSTYT